MGFEWVCCDVVVREIGSCFPCMQTDCGMHVQDAPYSNDPG